MALLKRGKTYYFAKRVPKRFAAYDKRGLVQISLKTDSESEALRKVPEVEANLEQYWVALSSGVGDEDKFNAMVKIAAAKGVRYQPENELMSRGLGEVLRRIEVLEAGEADDPVVSAAVLGAVKRPVIRLSQMAELFFESEKTNLKGKSEDQVRRWKNPRLKAFNNLVHVLGDVDIMSIERDDALEFRDWWQDRIVDEDLTANSANKDITYIAASFQNVIDRKRLTILNHFKGLRFKQTEKRRPPFSEDWVRDKFVASVVTGPNDQARDIFFTLVNTGCRPAEVAGLETDDIVLDHNVPHIKVRPNQTRDIKNKASTRDIPLVGISLEAMRRHPNGFPRYAGKDRFSDDMNRYLRAEGLLESEGHTVYGLRHSFEDRLLALNVPDRLAADLMGHSTVRERYGSGASLVQKLEALNRLAL